MPYVKRVPPRRSPSKTRSGARDGATRAAASRDEAKARTREALVTAALELFAAEGLDAPSLDAICDRAGYTRGAFYVHFADREELLVAVMDRVGEAFLRWFFAPLAGASAPGGAGLVRAAIARFVEAVASGAYPLMAEPGSGAPLVRPHQLLDACARSPEVRARYRGLVEASVAEVGRLLREDQESGAVRRDVDATDAARLMLAVIVGAQTIAELGAEVEPVRLAGAIERMLAPPGKRSSGPSGAASR